MKQCSLGAPPRASEEISRTTIVACGSPTCEGGVRGGVGDTDLVVPAIEKLNRGTYVRTSISERIEGDLVVPAQLRLQNRAHTINWGQ